MDMKGEYRIPADRETVWEALNNPEVLKACITGCKSLDRTEDGGFEAVVVAKVGPVKATFKGAVTLENVNPPESYTITGEGKGGAAGFAKGGADVKLTADGDETILEYTVNAQVGGKLAQIGGRLIDSTAKKYATEFFDKFVAHIADSNPAAETASESEAETIIETSATTAPQAPDAAETAENDTKPTPEEFVTETVVPTGPAVPPTDLPTSDKSRGMASYQWIILVVAALLVLTYLFSSS